MFPLPQETQFTFRFAEDRLIPRFHLQGLEAGQKVLIFSRDPESGLRSGLLAHATVGDDGWVTLEVPLRVQARGGFIVVLMATTPGEAAR